MWTEYCRRQNKKLALITAVRKNMSVKPSTRSYEKTESLVIGWFFMYGIPCLIVLAIYNSREW